MPAFANIAVDLLLPPTSLAVLVVLALLLRRVRAATVLAGVLLALSMPLVSNALLASLVPEPDAEGGAAPGAVVILSADVDRLPVGGEPGALTLERERAGATLARRTGLPILVTGGVVIVAPPVGEMMARSLEEDFRLPVRWVENASGTTWENASLSAPMLKAAGISRVYLVTHAWHMRRSLLAFRRAGLDPVQAAVRPVEWPRLNVNAVLPRASAWRDSYFGIHEWIGLLFYRLRP